MRVGVYSFVAAPLAGLVIALGSASAARADTLVTWQAGGGQTISSNTGLSGDFDSATLTFAPVTANSLDWEGEAFGDGYLHTHSAAPVTGNLSVRLDGTWTQVATFATSNQFFLSSLPALSFTRGIVDGVQLTSLPAQNQSFHSISGDVLRFADSGPSVVPAAAPLPSSAWAGLALMGGLSAARVVRGRRYGAG